ncbi:CRISPR-associated helicase Cas3' [Streptosporangium saharense]
MSNTGSNKSFAEGLSKAARAVWAKHDHDANGWLPLWRHMADSGAVAGLLWDHWLPAQVRRLIAEALPEGEADARKLAVWLATTHDIGKATPAFACQVESLATAMHEAGLEMPVRERLTDRRLAPHGLAGLVLLQEWLIERYGWAKTTTLQFGIVAGGHHGVPPTSLDVKNLNDHPELLRTPSCAKRWRDVQWEILDRCARVCEVGDRLVAWREAKLTQPAQVLLTGLVIVADWIASNSDLFPYFPDAANQSDEERVGAAWRGLDLPSPWRATEPVGEAADLFASRFSLPAGARIRPVQEHAVRLAREMDVPGLMVIEAPMGEGKTEAALAVAEIFAARSGAGGCFVALPTMATGSAMFPRLLKWLRRLPGERRSVLLAHSKAALNDDYAELMRAGKRGMRAIEQDGERRRGQRPTVLVAHRWLRGAKKGMLASFVTGTIDQLLFMGLKSRHLALRHLALAGKIVVIDEAHAYDAYMNSYLDRVLTWLGAYRVPVVVLSATLPAARRRELAEAYAGAKEGHESFVKLEAAEGYPLLTTVQPGGEPTCEPVAASGRETAVLLERLGDDLDELRDRLAKELAEGGCALVVRNTVDRVLETAACLREEFGAENVTVAHAQFIDLDRAAKDAGLLDRFGPPERSERRRPVGRPHIVVASQVAEQSLDIDFDLLVSDLCPIDLLLQRMGRLHRHVRDDRPEPLRTARCLVTGADWTATPIEPVKGSRAVYGAYALLRSAAVLEPYLTGSAPTGHAVRLPQDISPLVQRAYGPEPVGPDSWQEALAHAHKEHDQHRDKQHDKAQSFQLAEVAKAGRSLLGWIEAGVGDADDSPRGRAQVRDGLDSVEVLVVQRRADDSLVTMPWLDRDRGGLDLPVDTAPEPNLARIVASCGLRLPRRFSYPQVIDQTIEELEAGYIPAWQSKESPWLAGELLLVLDEEGRARLAGHDLYYTPDDGLKVTRAE